MTDKQFQQAISQLPAEEHFDRVYNAFEGGIRIISKDEQGNEYRYNVAFDSEDNAHIERY